MFNKKFVHFLLVCGLFFFSIDSHAATAQRYRLQFMFSGNAQGKILFFIPFRFYFESKAELELKAEADSDGGQHFNFERVSAPAYVLRTLGFSGKALVMVTAFTDYKQGDDFTKQRVADWFTEQPSFAKYIKIVKKLPFMVENRRPEAFSFDRPADGLVQNVQNSLELQYKHYPQEIGIYFRVYPLLKEMLALYNHGVWPDGSATFPQDLPPEWKTKAMDLSVLLNRIGAQIERIVASTVKFDQEEPFVMKYRVASQNQDMVEIVGSNQQKPLIWRSYCLDGFIRRLRIRPGDGALLRDELELTIGNKKGIAGQGRLLLELIEPEI